MAIGFGPFESHVFPGVFTQTVTEKVGGPPPGIRPLVVIGVGQEYLNVRDIEVVRGSSSVADQQIYNEDVSDRFVVSAVNPAAPVLGPCDGTLARFKVRNFPIVTGTGSGITATSAASVKVTVNGDAVAVATLSGAVGEVVLQAMPAEGDAVLCTYYFKRTDTQVTDNVSNQVTATAALLYAVPESYIVVAGVNDAFALAVNGVTERTVTLTAGTRTATHLAADMTAAGITGLTASVDVNELGQNRLQLSATGEITIGSGTANALLGFTAGQNSGRNRVFATYQRPIVDGSNGGITTNVVSDVAVTVNATAVTVTGLDGANGRVTLQLPPAVGSTVAITYYYNTFQDTFDYIPNKNVVAVGNCGIAPKRTDYTNLTDFVVEEGMVHWGASDSIVAGEHTSGAEPFDKSQISTLLVDDRIYMASCERYVNSAVSPAVVSDVEFVLPLVPTVGDGRDTPLGDPDLVVAYYGSDVRDALNRGAQTVVSADSATRRIKLSSPVPPNDTVYATFWYNQLSDAEYTVSCLTSGASGVGSYNVLSSLTGLKQLNTTFGTGTKTGTTETIQWPSGVETRPDAIHYGGTPVPETATVTFSASLATPAIFVNALPGPYTLYSGTSDGFAHNIDSLGASSVTLSTNSGFCRGRWRVGCFKHFDPDL
jgi:hypothetical protein